MKPIACLAVLLAALLAGCLGGTESGDRGDAVQDAVDWRSGWTPDDTRLSQPVHGVTDHPLEMVGADGTRLDAHVWRPDGDGQFPVIVELSPYRGVPGFEAGDPQLRGAQYPERGYALVSVSVRGTGNSDGCMDWQGEKDIADYEAIFDQIVAQPWSDGNIGGVGISWIGTTLNAALLTGHPALKTVIPVAAISDWYRWPFLDGISMAYTGYTWNAYSTTLPGAPAADILQGDVEPSSLATRVCPDLVAAELNGGTSAADGTRNAWWDARNFSALADTVRPGVGVMLVNGYHDLGVRVDHLPHWIDALHGAGAEVRTLIGQWGHQYPDSGLQIEGYRERIWMDDWQQTQLRWFDHWLKGKDTGILGMPAVLSLDDQGAWHEDDAIEPSGASWQRLEFGDGVLGDATDGTATFLDNGVRPDPTGAGTATYVSEPMDVDTRIVDARVTLQLSHSMPLGQAGATIYRVTGDTWTPIAVGFADYRLRDSVYDAAPVRPGEVFEVEVDLLDYDWIAAQGDRIGITIAGQVLEDSANRNDPPEFVPRSSGGVSTIYHGGSFIELLTMPRSGS